MKRFILLIVIFGLVGCKKEDPNPELLDPIYVDLDQRATSAQKAYDEELKKQADTKIALEKALANTIELKNAQKDLAKSQSIAVDLEQKARFYQIRAKRRLFVDRITYKAAFAKDEKWPDPREYSDYQVNMRLQESSRNWGARVPKLQNRLASLNGKDPKAKEKTSKSEE
jgi:hypothetical protein